MIYKLVSKAGNQVLELPIERMVVAGRSVTCDFVIDEPTMSRVHAEISPVEGGVMLKDLGSSNGTFLNGSRIGMAIVMPGDTIGLGEAEFTLVEDAVPPEPAQSQPPELAKTVAVDHFEPPQIEPPPAQPAPPEIQDLEEPPAEMPEPEPEPEPEAIKAYEAKEQPQPDVLRFTRTRESANFEPYEFFTSAAEAAAFTSFVNLHAESGWKRSLEELCLLLNISQELFATQSIDLLLDTIVDRIFTSMDVDRAGVWLFNPDGSTQQKYRSTVEGSEPEFDIPPPILDKVLADRIAVVADLTDRYSNNHTRLCAPMLNREGDILGLLYIDSMASSDSFGDPDLGFMIAFAGVAAAAIQGLIAHQQLRETLVPENTATEEAIPEEPAAEDAATEEPTPEAAAIVESAPEESAPLANALLRYFTPDLAEQITLGETAISLVPSSYQAAVLTGVFVNSTGLATSLPTNDFAVLLLQIRAAVKDLVFKYEGMLLQSTGDGFTAAWGIPLAVPDAADRTIAAAMEILDAVARIGDETNASPQIGIGIDFGKVIAGNFGADGDIDIAAVGEPVNEAAKLSIEAGPAGIAISQTCLESLTNPPDVGPLRFAYRVKR